MVILKDKVLNTSYYKQVVIWLNLEKAVFKLMQNLNAEITF